MSTKVEYPSSGQHDAKLPVMRRWFFFYEGEEDGWTFEVEAKDHEEALQVAYDNHGPQVCSMYFREVSNGA